MNKILKYELLAGGSQKGQTAILMSYFILSIILLVALTVANLMVAEIQMSRGVANSVPAYFASDAGVERCLYEIYAAAGVGCDAPTGFPKTYVYNMSNGAMATINRQNANNINSDGVFADTHRKINLNW